MDTPRLATIQTLLALLTLACAAPVDDSAVTATGGKADETLGPPATQTYVSASSVDALALGEDPAAAFAAMDPPLAETWAGDPLEAWESLKPLGVQGFLGPLGPYGPLGRGGPVGWRWYNPAAPIETVGSQLDVFGIWLEAVAAWYGAFAQLTGGAWRYRADQLQAYLSWLNQARFESQILSHEGPLAAGGPLNPERFGDADLLDQLNTPGGALAVSGPWGPLGALGPLGPLGPLSPLVAVQGYQNDAEGRFVPGVNGCFRPADDGEEAVCRTVLVPWEPQDEPCERRTANCRRYELYESYDEAFAQAFDDNDTSFMVIGRAAMSDEDDVYELTSRETQYVTVLLTPEEKPLIDATALQGLYIATGQLPGSPALFDRDLMLMPEALERMPGAWALFYDHATAFDDFDLTVEILDADGRPARRATSIMGGGRNMPDWIQVRVPAGTRLRVRVRLYARRVGIPGNPEFFTPSQADYRLFVTGSTARAPIGPSTGAPRVPLERLDAL